MKKFVAMMMAVSFATVGCTGSFALTKKVYNFHRMQDDKWSDEFAFLVVTLLPIYGIATFADAIVFNSIEFWTGDNPAMKAEGSNNNIRHVKAGDGEATIVYDRATDQLILHSRTMSGENPSLVFERNGSAVYAKDLDGKMLYASMDDGQGGIAVYDSNMQLVKKVSAEEVARAKERLLN